MCNAVGDVLFGTFSANWSNTNCFNVKKKQKQKVNKKSKQSCDAILILSSMFPINLKKWYKTVWSKWIKYCDDEHFNCAVFINIILSCGSHLFPLSVVQQSQTITFHQSILECVRVCKRVLISLSPSCDFNRIWDHQPSFCFSGFS